MKGKHVFVLVPMLVLGAGIFSTADASPAAGNIAWPLSLITRPCVSISVQGPGSGPPRVVCLGVTGRAATVNMPTPWLSDRAPELSLVSIPTFFNLKWDPQSVGAQDSAPLTMSYPVGNPTDKLINVRVQLRLRPEPYPASASESRPTTANISVQPSPSVFLVNPDHPNDYYGYACDPSNAGNALLSISAGKGGYDASRPCDFIRGLLQGVSDAYPFDEFVYPATGGSKTLRYLNWPNTLSMPVFLAFTPFASIYGAGTDQGFPAFQLSATTRFAVEARVVWDEHQERQETVTTDCQWSYKDNYDFIDWSRWPDPVYCRHNVEVSWPTFCKPFEGTCDRYYGNPNDWWIPYVPALEVQAVRRPDGTYGTTYDFVSVQSQSILTAP